MDKRVQCFYACPECGTLAPYLQRRCDCGYRFRRRWPNDRRLVVAIVILSVLLVCSAGVIWYQHEVLPWKWAVNSTPLLSEKYGEGYNAGYAAGMAAVLAEEEKAAGSFAEWSDAKQAAEETAPISTLPPLTSPPALPSLTLPSLRGD